jgi:phosphoribosylamine--glycine ligase
VSQPKVLVVLGSDSDLPVMQACLDTLKKFGVPYEARVCSAHRSPRAAHELASTARDKGFQVIIAAAGGAAHLAGAMAANTTLPVIGVPLASSPLSGVDALHATVQMPPGVPVATVSIGEWGARNAGVLAAQILSLGDAPLATKLEENKRDLEEQVAKKDRALQDAAAKPAK